MRPASSINSAGSSDCTPVNGKRAMLLVAALALAGTGLALVWAAGAWSGTGTRPAPITRVIEDSTGRAVRIPHDPQHILSLCTSVTDTLVRLGQGHRLAGIDEYSRIVPDTGEVPVLGKGSTLSREQVLARAIDLAFIWWFQDDVAQLLGDLGIPTVRIRCQQADDVPATIRLVGQCLNDEAGVPALAESVERDLARLRRSITGPHPRVYLELYSPFRTGGRDTYLHDLLELAGARNVAAGAVGSLIFSAEALLEADPDVVLLIRDFATPASFRQRTGMAGLTAVRSGRVHLLDRTHLIAGAGLPDAVRHLRNLFTSLDESAIAHALP